MTYFQLPERQPFLNGSGLPPIEWTKIESIFSTDNVEELESILQNYNNFHRQVLKPKNIKRNSTSLHMAASSAAPKCLKKLLGSSAAEEFMNYPDKDGHTPIHSGVKSGDSKSLQALLDASVHVNCRDEYGDTPLHILAKELKTDNLTKSVILGCLNKLLDKVGVIDLDPINKVKQTPLMIAVSYLSSKENPGIETDVLLFCEKLVNKGASMDIKIRKNETICDVLKEISPNPAFVHIRQNPPEKPSLSHLFDAIISGEDISHNIFKYKDALKEVGKLWIGEYTVLQYAIDTSNYDAVKVLLDVAKVNPCHVDEKNKNVAFYQAISRGHVGILEFLIKKMLIKERTDKLNFKESSYDILYTLIANFRTGVHVNPNINYRECLNILLNSNIELDVNQKMVDQTALHLALDLNNQDAIQMLIVAGADYGTELSIIRPLTLNRAFDNCITHTKDPNAGSEDEVNILNSDYSLTLDYHSLVPQKNDFVNSYDFEVKIINEINKSQNQKSVITHPIIQVLLYIKWRNILLWYFINLGIYFIFLVCSTRFMYCVADLRILEERQQANLTGFFSNITIEKQIEYYSYHAWVSKWFLFPTTLYLILREVFQMVSSRWKYWHYKNIENYLEIFLIVSVSTLSFFTLNVEFTRHISAWATIAAGYEFVLILSRMSSLSIYITMLKNVCWNFFKMIFLFSALIIIFAISFRIIFYPAKTTGEMDSDSTDFSSILTSLPKSIAMATGEFGYSEDLTELFYSVVGFVAFSRMMIFFAFVYLIFFVLINIMTGLAVTDTQQIVTDTNIHTLNSRLELIYLTEKLFSFIPYLKARYQLFPDGTPPILEVFINERNHSKRVKLPTGKTARLSNEANNILKNHWLDNKDEVNDGDLQKEFDVNVCLKKLLRKIEIIERRLPN